MIQVQVQHSFYRKQSFYQNFPPPLAAHAFKYNIPFDQKHSFYQVSPPPLGNPCFQWLRSKYNIPFIKKFPPPYWQPMLSMIQVQVQQSFYQKHSFYQNFPPRLLAAHAFKYNFSSATLPSYFFQSTIPNRGRVTQHSIQPNIASKPANAPRRRAVTEPRPHNTHQNLDTVFCEPYPTTLSITNAEL